MSVTVDPMKIAGALNMSLGDLSDMLRVEAAKQYELAARVLRQQWPATPDLALEKAANMMAAIRAVDAALEQELDALPDSDDE